MSLQFKRRVFSIESSRLCVDVASRGANPSYCYSYSTFVHGQSHNQSDSAQHQDQDQDQHKHQHHPLHICISNCSSLLSVALQFAFPRKSNRWKTWTILAGIVLILILLYTCIVDQQKKSKPLIQADSFLFDEQWDYNHDHDHDHDPSETNTHVENHRHLLVVQLATTATHALSRITSRPNRAYARQWGLDFYLTYDCHCPAQLLLDFYQMQRFQGEEETLQVLVPVYDAVLILSPESIITNMDFDILTLLPQDMLATITTNGEQLRLINLRHDMFPTLVKLWLESSCHDAPPLVEMVESVVSTQSEYVTIHPSMAGFLEPKLVRFSDRPTTLQTTADSVCYRYYPRCDVL